MQLAYVSNDRKRELYTTHLIIAKCAGIEKVSVRKLIDKHKSELEEFGILSFEMTKINNGRGRPQKIYHLNEQQATLLITWLDNTEPVRKFKLELVQAFFDLRNQVAEFKLQRVLEKPKRKQLTDSIQKWQHASKWSYKALTDLLLKQVTGKTAKQLKRGASCTALDLLTGKQLERYQALEQLVISLVELNYTYNEIKAILQKGE
ncbi:Rha family transcriptional regulator [Aerococcaceae bacterium NML191219]|nr:Rha family transcriptional regulator [Aerococcaceae bacterium NML191219]